MRLFKHAAADQATILVTATMLVGVSRADITFGVASSSAVRVDIPHRVLAGRSFCKHFILGSVCLLDLFPRGRHIEANSVKNAEPARFGTVSGIWLETAAGMSKSAALHMDTALFALTGLNSAPER